MDCQADERGRDAWVISSNTINTNFYRSLGFVSEAKLVLGEDNPTWDRPPVVCPLVRHTTLLSTYISDSDKLNAP